MRPSQASRWRQSQLQRLLDEPPRAVALWRVIALAVGAAAMATTLTIAISEWAFHR